MNSILGAKAVDNMSQTAACRESSATIIERRLRENSGRSELYSWLLGSLNRAPMSKDCEEALWSMLVRERPY